MNGTAFVAALLGAVVAFAYPAHAQQVGEACTGSAANITTVRSTIETEGVIQCIPNSQGQYFWQAMGAGVALYDNTASCTIAGMLRWNGSAIQYCNGSIWNNLGGGGLGNLHQSGGESFYCDPGYTIVGFQFNCGCTNNAIFFECQPQ
jgi:hypothetical protein